MAVFLSVIVTDLEYFRVLWKMTTYEQMKPERFVKESVWKEQVEEQR